MHPRCRGLLDEKPGQPNVEKSSSRSLVLWIGIANLGPALGV